jgi:hypothetical protein
VTVRRCARRRALATLLAILALTVTLTATPSGLLHATAAWAPTGPLVGLGSGRVWSLAIDPADPKVVLAATDHGVFRSADGAATWAQTSLATGTVWTVGFDLRKPNPALAGLEGGGVARSDDGGVTWKASTAGLPSPTVRALAFGLSGMAAGTTDGVAVSVDGTAWQNVGLQGFDISALGMSANTPQITLVAAADHVPVGTSGHLFRNAGLAAAWEQLTAGPAQAVVSSLAVGPLPADTQIRALIATTSAGVFRSGDGGTNWTKVYPASGQDAATNATLTATAFSPLDPKLVYAGNDAGGSGGGDLLRSTDGGLTFSPYDDGLPPAGRNVGAIAISPTSPPLVVAALNPPDGGGRLVAQTDSTAPAPAPTGTPEVAQPLPSQTSLPTFTPPPASVTAPLLPDAGGRSVFRRAVDWPLPLALELLVIVVGVYVFLRWRQRHLDIEGPP